ncbi:oxygenase MpaB family protein [Nocardia neocaledoniensis]|uniref:oxygenase MpaB family protein n=1 Tax=Nocardia neocaledoniensis TaxID=236511 RepID=UPI002455926B|nr:oxygenase MpaB family protein [Nocardia neocaledoniensis]
MITLPKLRSSAERPAAEIQPAADYGFFGPESVTWKVWSYPTSIILGFGRAVTIEHLDPNLTAAAVAGGGVKSRPHTRFSRTVRYFAMAAFGASEPTVKAADVLVKVHSKAIGIDPVTGGHYDANKPSSQLWIHMTAWHSILHCYEKFGPGRLTDAEDLQFWAECARAAELQTIDPVTVPRSREEVRAYFDAWRPHLCSSEAARDMVDFLLAVDIALPPDLARWQRLAYLPFTKLLSKGIVASYPHYARELLGIKQSRSVDAAVTPLLKSLHALVAKSPELELWLLKLLAPAAVDVFAPVVLGIPALDPSTTTPREAQRRYGFDVPNEAHLDLRAKQFDRVFNKGLSPSDEGLIESQAHIGNMQPTPRASA